jgi:hypothetical protein
MSQAYEIPNTGPDFYVEVQDVDVPEPGNVIGALD